jgi:2-methylcitrate dehydratase
MSADNNNNTAWDQVLVDIITYVYRFQLDSPRAWTIAKHAILDALGCAIESQHVSAECRNLLGPIVPGTHVPNGSRLPGTMYQLDPIKCAFDLGTCIRYMDHNDAIGGAEAGHPSGIFLSFANDLAPSDIQR